LTPGSAQHSTVTEKCFIIIKKYLSEKQFEGRHLATKLFVAYLVSCSVVNQCSFEAYLDLDPTFHFDADETDPGPDLDSDLSPSFTHAKI
jgi:hypothetical protein